MVLTAWASVRKDSSFYHVLDVEASSDGVASTHEESLLVLAIETALSRLEIEKLSKTKKSLSRLHGKTTFLRDDLTFLRKETEIGNTVYFTSRFLLGTY